MFSVICLTKLQRSFHVWPKTDSDGMGPPFGRDVCLHLHQRLDASSAVEAPRRDGQFDIAKDGLKAFRVFDL